MGKTDDLKQVSYDSVVMENVDFDESLNATNVMVIWPDCNVSGRNLAPTSEDCPTPGTTGEATISPKAISLSFDHFGLHRSITSTSTGKRLERQWQWQRKKTPVPHRRKAISDRGI